MPDEATQQPVENESGDGDWTPPATQADLNRIIEARLAREREKFKDYPDLKAKAEKFDEVEEAQKSELEKALARADEAEKKIHVFESERQIQSWKADVSKDTGVPAEVLHGSTLEELQAHAEVLKPLIKQAQRGPIVPNAGETPNQTALNGDGITDSLKRALGIP